MYRYINSLFKNTYKTLSQFLTISLVFLGLTNNVFAESLSENQRHLVDNIQSMQAQQLKLLEQIVNINSGTENKTGVEKVGEILTKSFRAIGFKAKWVPLPETMHHAGTLLLEHHPSKYRGKKLLLIGHLDTVFSPESSFQTFSRKGDWASGPGIADIKGGDLVILYALRSLFESNLLGEAYITVALIGDEEDSAKPHSISRKALIEAAEDAEVALEFEMAFNAEQAVVGRRGIIDWKMESLGSENHSASLFKPQVGDGAAFEVTRNLNAFYQLSKHNEGLTINAALIASGTHLESNLPFSSAEISSKMNVISKRAIAAGDIRFISQSQAINIKNKMKHISQQHLPHTNTKIEFADPMLAMTATTNNYSLLKLYSLLSQQLGMKAVTAYDPKDRGGSDISFIADKVRYNLAGLGAIGAGPHSDKEEISISGLTANTQRAALLIYHLTRNKSL